MVELFPGGLTFFAKIKTTNFRSSGLLYELPIERPQEDEKNEIFLDFEVLICEENWTPEFGLIASAHVHTALFSLVKAIFSIH